MQDEEKKNCRAGICKNRAVVECCGVNRCGRCDAAHQRRVHDTAALAPHKSIGPITQEMLTGMSHEHAASIRDQLLASLAPVVTFMKQAGIAGFRMPAAYSSVDGHPDLEKGYIEIQAHTFTGAVRSRRTRTIWIAPYEDIVMEDPL